MVTQVGTEQPPNTCVANPGSGNPIYPARGTKREVISTGVQLGDLALRLTYDSARRSPRTNPDTDLPDAETLGFGELWSSSFHRRLIIEPGAFGARALRGDGTTVSFAGNGSGVFVANPSTDDRLISVDGEYRFIDARSRAIERYSLSGKLLEIRMASGQSVSFTYSDSTTAASIAPAAGYLIRAADGFGRAVDLKYVLPAGADPARGGRVGQVIDPAGGVISFEYTDQNLARFTWADMQARQLLYGNAGFPWALTGVISENQARYSTFGYDAAGRSISTELAGGVDQYVASHSSAPLIAVVDSYDGGANIVRRTLSWLPPVGTSVTQPNGSTVELDVGIAAGAPAVSRRSQPAGSGCGAAASSITYDANANLASVDDFNGTRVCYVNDLSRNLETTRVEGLVGGASCSVTAAGSALPAGSRKVSTLWHPDWTLKTRVAEPGRVTTYVYNGQPDPYAGGAPASCAAGTGMPDGRPIAVLCHQVEMATTDADGAQGFNAAAQPGVALREQRWTYNALGQVLTHDGPRSDINDITTYEYYVDTAFSGAGPDAAGHTRGDLMRVTNPAGHVTQFPLYNRTGQVLQSVDPNGVVTSHSYDARQRLTSTTVGGQTTSYAWWPTGLIQRVTAPDGSWTYFDHDDAHRLWRISDNLGNSVSYTLDALGNRTAEQVQDPNGVLRRQVTRDIDALGRVQQVTGRE